MGRTELLDPKGLRREPWLVSIFIESEMALLSECMQRYVQKTFDIADIVREATLQRSP
jgi:hypothetical protein